MTGKHLTDEEIQKYVTSLKTQSSSPFYEHFATCISCKTKADNYVQMITALEAQSIPVFDFDVTELILSQLPVRTKKSKFKMIFAHYDLIALICILIGMAIYFRKSLIALFSGSMIINLLLLTTIVLILCFQIIDMQKKHKKKMDMLEIL